MHLQADRQRSVLRRKPQAPALAVAALAALLAAGATAAAPVALAPADLLERVSRPTLDTRHAVVLEDVELPLGRARLRFERGTLVPAAPIDGHRVEAIFTGTARFQAEPPDAIEAGQLQLFTGQSVLDLPVHELALVLTGGEIDALTARGEPVALDAEGRDRDVRAVFEEWVDSPARRGTGVVSSTFKHLAGDAAFSRYLAVWCRSELHGDFVYQYDPEDVEPWTIAGFSPLDVQGWERQRLERHIRIQQRKGRFLGVRVQDLGAWDIWTSARADGDEPGAADGDYGFEPSHYELQVSIARRTMEMDARARIDVEASGDGRRALTLELHPDLVVKHVRDGQGKPLFFFRSGREIVVLLREPTRAGQRLAIEVDYAGRGLRWVGRRQYELVDTEAWYPHCGSLDRATYDVTLQWPRKRELIAAGRLVDGGRRGAFRWERRRIDVPTIAFSFALGDYLIEEHDAGNVRLRLAFLDSGEERYGESVRRRAAETIRSALGFFERSFGPYPLDDLTVVVQPRRFSQSYLSFILLTDSVMADDVPQVANWVRNTTIAHEVAHQWWGNLLGWWSYRDQWLGEAVANYAALLFHARTEGRDEEFLATMSAGWRDTLERTLFNGRTLESFGPVVLGPRLNSSRSAFGYRAVVYRKGAVVLAMLARVIGEEPFLGMLRSLVEAASNRVLTTESFLESIERMSGRDLDGFARQYVYGTGIPDVYYDYDTRQEGERWVVEGEVRRLARFDTEHRVVRDGDGRWDVLSRLLPIDDDRSTDLMVPFRIGLETAKVRIGEMLIRGGEDRFRVELDPGDPRPTTLDLDPRGELLAHFLSAEEDPKRYARYRAENLWRTGDLDGAEAAYREALQLEARVDPREVELSLLRDPERENRQENARVWLALARIWLERGDDAGARAAMEQVDDLFGADRTSKRMERDTLWARLEIRAGDYAAAHKRLRRTMRLAAPRRAAHNWRAQLWLVRLGAEYQATTAGFALLAVAAHETGDGDDLAWALDEARDRGVDLGPLAAVDPL